MAVRSIVTDADPILRKSSRPITEFDARLHELLDDMRATLRAAGGAGLAAPQVGILRRAVVMDTAGGIVEMINPRILSASGKKIAREGCLSIKGKSLDICRPNRVKAEFQDRYGNMQSAEFENFEARLLCHETEHLDGILYYDEKIRRGE